MSGVLRLAVQGALNNLADYSVGDYGMRPGRGEFLSSGATRSRNSCTVGRGTPSLLKFRDRERRKKPLEGSVRP